MQQMHAVVTPATQLIGHMFFFVASLQSSPVYYKIDRGSIFLFSLPSEK